MSREQTTQTRRACRRALAPATAATPRLACVLLCLAACWSRCGLALTVRVTVTAYSPVGRCTRPVRSGGTTHAAYTPHTGDGTRHTGHAHGVDTMTNSELYVCTTRRSRVRGSLSNSIVPTLIFMPFYY